MFRGVTAGRPPLDGHADRRHRRRLDRARRSERTASPTASTSLDVGCVRVTERFLGSDPPTAAELDEAAAYVRSLLPDVRGARRRSASPAR